LHHWVANVHLVEFREHGLVTYNWFCPWDKMTRIGWSPAVRNQLVFLYAGRFRDVDIDPAAWEAVDALLPKIDARRLAS
jgi:hypothetical protein